MANKIHGIGEKTKHHLLVFKVLVGDVSYGSFDIESVVHHFVNESPKLAVLLKRVSVMCEESPADAHLGVVLAWTNLP